MPSCFFGEPAATEVTHFGAGAGAWGDSLPRPFVLGESGLSTLLRRAAPSNVVLGCKDASCCYAMLCFATLRMQGGAMRLHAVLRYVHARATVAARDPRRAGGPTNCH